jgi:hypothetical protein
MAPSPLRPSIVKTGIAKVNNLDSRQSVAAQRHHRLAIGKDVAISLCGNGFGRVTLELLAGMLAFVLVRLMVLVTVDGLWNPGRTFEGLKYRSG